MSVDEEPMATVDEEEAADTVVAEEGTTTQEKEARSLEGEAPSLVGAWRRVMERRDGGLGTSNEEESSLLRDLRRILKRRGGGLGEGDESWAATGKTAAGIVAKEEETTSLVRDWWRILRRQGDGLRECAESPTTLVAAEEEAPSRARDLPRNLNGGGGSGLLTLPSRTSTSQRNQSELSLVTRFELLTITVLRHPASAKRKSPKQQRKKKLEPTGSGCHSTQSASKLPVTSWRTTLSVKWSRRGWLAKGTAR